MEATLLGGWLPYVTQNPHGAGFPAKTLCEVSFRKRGGDRKFFVIVRRNLNAYERANGKQADRNHPDKILCFPKPDYWFWPGLEDETQARKRRGIPRQMTGLRGHRYFTKARVLKPY